MMKTLLMSTAAAMLVAGTAYAQDVVVAIDTDGDGMVSVSEWNAYRTQTRPGFRSVDADADSMLSADEYTSWREAQDDADSFGTWDETLGQYDADADSMLTQEEYNTGLFSAWDVNQDQMLDAEETKAWEGHEMSYDATVMGRQKSQ